MTTHLHPVISGTVALWQLQSDLTDSSGNGYDAAMDVGTAGYTAINADINGFNFHRAGSFDIIAPSVAALRLTGDMTIEYLAVEFGTVAQDFVDCLQGTTSSTSLYTCGYSVTNAFYYKDNANASQNFTGTLMPASGELHHWAFRRSGHVVDMFLDGVKQTSISIASLPTSAGTERLRIGAVTAGWNAYVASFRVLNNARSDANILADAQYCLGLTPRTSISTSTYIPDASQPYRPFYYLKITGLPYYFFSGIDPTDAKWGAAQWTLPTGYTSIKGMDTPSAQFDQALPDLIGGIATAERITLSMLDFNVTDSTGTHSFFAGLLSPGYLTNNTSAIIGTLDANVSAGLLTGAIYVKGSGGAFSAQDTYIGGETFGVSAVSGPDGESRYTLTVNARNKYPCNANYPPQGSYYVPLDSNGTVVPDQVILATQGAPLTFINRSAALYIGHLRADGLPEAESAALCRLIGHLKGINYGQDPGKFEFVIESVLGSLATTKLAPQLGHGDIGNEIYLTPEVWRGLTIDIQAQDLYLGTTYTARKTTRLVIDDSSTNVYPHATDISRQFNDQMTLSGPIMVDFGGAAGSLSFTVSLSIISGDGGKAYAQFKVGLPALNIADHLYTQITIGSSSYDPSLGSNPPSPLGNAGLMAALGFPAAVILTPGEPPDSTTAPFAYATAPRSVPVCFVPTGAVGSGITIGFNHNQDQAGLRFFTDQGDGSGTAYVRYGDGQIGEVLATSSIGITVGASGHRAINGWRFNGADSGMFYYVEQGDVAIVDQVVRVPSQVTGSAERALFQLLASKGYSADTEFNVFTEGIGLGLDGILDKDSVRNAAFAFTDNYLSYVDSTMTFADLWTGHSKAQGMFLVWDPLTAQISLRLLHLANYVDAVSPNFTESNRSDPNDRSQAVSDTANLRTGWIIKSGWDPMQKKFMAPDLTLNDAFAALAYQQSSRTETLEMKMIPPGATDLVNDGVVPALIARSVFTRYPWVSVTRTMNKTGLLLSPGQYHKIADNTLINPFSRKQGIALTDNVFVWVSRVQSQLDTGAVSVTFLLDQTNDQAAIRPWSPTGLVSFPGGYNSSTGVLTMSTFYSQQEFDGADFVVGDNVVLTTRDNDGAPAYWLTTTVSAVATDGSTVTVGTGLGSLSSTRETVLILDDWGSQTTDRQTGDHRVSFQGSGDTLLIASSGRLHKWG